jgi:hypothetical protein
MIEYNGKKYEYPEWSRELPEGSILLYSDIHGEYIPQKFHTDFKDNSKVAIVGNVPDWSALSHPNNEGYWDEWYIVCNDTYIFDPMENKLYSVYQDGDCWLIPMKELVYVSDNILEQIEQSVKAFYKAGCKYEHDSRFGLIVVTFDEDTEYVFQGEDYDYITKDCPENVNIDDYIIWLSRGW